MARLLPVVLLTLLLAACGGDGGGGPDQTERAEGGQAPGSTAVRGGTTGVELDPALAQALEDAGAELAPIGGAEGGGGELRFPITGGTLDPAAPSGRVEHEGGLRITAGDREVEASELVVDVGGKQVTAEVDGERVPLFDITDTAPRVPVEGGVATLEGRLALPEDSALAERLGLPVPAGGLPVGRLVTSARRS